VRDDRPCIHVAKPGEIDDVVSVTPADACTRAPVEKTPVTAHHGGQATLPPGRLRAVGACEPCQIREEAALSIHSRCAASPALLSLAKREELCVPSRPRKGATQTSGFNCCGICHIDWGAVACARSGFSTGTDVVRTGKVDQLLEPESS